MSPLPLGRSPEIEGSSLERQIRGIWPRDVRREVLDLLHKIGENEAAREILSTTVERLFRAQRQAEQLFPSYTLPTAVWQLGSILILSVHLLLRQHGIHLSPLEELALWAGQSGAGFIGTYLGMKQLYNLLVEQRRWVRDRWELIKEGLTGQLSKRIEK
uniref:Uncharacterized protein n=1 Tax=candidate division CPR3 bacterium TaxID=2268181 RepID=A0A7C5URF2_UNCC3